jgi:hypothetical protein
MSVSVSWTKVNSPPCAFGHLRLWRDYHGTSAHRKISMRHIRAPFNRPALFEEGVSEVPDRYGQQSARHHHGFSQMDVVASLGALQIFNS